MSNIIDLDGKRYRVSPRDKHVFTPNPENIFDLTGQRLKVGTKVAWGTSYRGGGGAVIGEITEIGWKLGSASITEVDANDSTVYDAVTGTNYRGDTYTYQRPRYIPSEVWNFSIVVKSLTPNRKGNSFRDPHDVVVIAEQAFGSK